MTRRFLSTLSVILVAAATATSFAQSSVFPWEGEVTGNNVNVRSGEGTRYYATCKLALGDRVLVLGESSGWYKILPPPKSFSYIDKTAVERHTDDIGSVARDKAYVRAGSHISRRKSRTQVILKKGDPVVIVGEADGFYKIEPPKGAVLFISREYVKPVGPDHESNLVKQYGAANWKEAGKAAPKHEARAATPKAHEARTATPKAKAAKPAESARPTETKVAKAPQRQSPPTARPEPKPRRVTPNPLVRTKTKTPARNPEPTKPARTAPQPPIRANRPIQRAPQPKAPSNDTLVLTPNNPTNGATQPRTAPRRSTPRNEASTPVPPAANSDAYSRDRADDDRDFGDSNANRPELVPADRRPPARLPDWAEDGQSHRGAESSIAARDRRESVTSPRDVNNDRPESRTSSLDGRSSRESRSTVASSAGPNAPKKVGTMVEITPGAPRRSPAPNQNRPTRIASHNPPPRSTSPSRGTPIQPYQRPDSDTLTLNANDSNTPTTGATTPIASNTSANPPSGFDANNARPIRDDSAMANSQPANPGEAPYPTATTPPPDVPIDPNSGPYAAKLVSLEGDLHAIMEMPVQQRPYEELIRRYEDIAVQTDEQVPAQYASIRIDQLKSLERVRQLAVRYASDRQGLQRFGRRMAEERQEIRQAQQQQTAAKSHGTFEYEGQLMKSHAFSPEKRRYRLIDPGTQSTIIYVDIPINVVANPDALTGKHVGIRIGSRQYSEAAQIPIVEAAEVVDLSTPTTKYRPIPAPQDRKSDDFSNAGNSRADHPNPQMNEPVARERIAPATMGDMEPIES